MSLELTQAEDGMVLAGSYDIVVKPLSGDVCPRVPHDVIVALTDQFADGLKAAGVDGARITLHGPDSVYCVYAAEIVKPTGDEA